MLSEWYSWISQASDFDAVMTYVCDGATHAHEELLLLAQGTISQVYSSKF